MHHLIEMRRDTYHRELLDKLPRVAGAAGDYGGRVAAALQLGQRFHHMRKHFHPFGRIDLRHKVGKSELHVLGTHMLGNAEQIGIAQRLVITLAGQLRLMPEIAQSFSRGDIQRAMDIDQGTVQIEKYRLEFLR